MTDTLKHYGVAGMQWGVRKKYKPTGDRGSRQQTPAQRKAARQASMMGRYEYFNSIGRPDLAAKYAKDYNQAVAGRNDPGATLNPSAQKPAEEKAEPEPKKGKAPAEKKKGAPPPAPKKQKPKEDKEKDEKAKLLELAKTQKDVAKQFHAESVEATRLAAELLAKNKAISARMESFRADLKQANKNGDEGSANVIQGLIDRMDATIAANTAQAEVEVKVAERLAAKSEEWNTMAEKTLKKATGTKEKDTEVKHYGVKGMRWGVRKDRKAKSAGKIAKTLSDAELKKRVKRLNLEKQYVDLISQENQRNKSAVARGADEVGKVLANAGKNVLQQQSTQLFTVAVTAATAAAIKKKKG